MTRFVILHSFAGRAEDDGARRLVHAAAAMGIEAYAMHDPSGIDQFDPDFVLCLSHHEGRTTERPTYGVIMAPLAWYAHDPAAIDRILSYDGHLTLSETLAAWLEATLAAAGRRPLIGHYTNTVQATDWTPPRLAAPRLAYVGTNWDGWRHWDPFDRLARRGLLRVHGPVEAWRHLDPAAYGGPVPFDGHSILGVYRDAGVGLALDRADFAADDLPSLRIFEIVASGAVAIAGDIPFVRRHFADSVLYVDGTATAGVLVDQIADHMAWIAANPVTATDMSRAAHAVFVADLAAERLLPNVLDLHARATAAGPHRRTVLRSPPPRPHARRLETIEALAEGAGPMILPPGGRTVLEAAVRPFGRNAVLEVHVAIDADPPAAIPAIVTVAGTAPAGTAPAWETVGNRRRLRLPVDPAVLATGRIAVMVTAGPAGPVRLAGVALRQTLHAPVEPVSALPDGPVWIVGAAAGGRRAAEVLAERPGIRLAGFLDDFVAGPLLDRPVVPIAEAAARVDSEAVLVLATQHWPALWRHLGGLEVAAIWTAHPGNGREVMRLSPLPDPPADQGAAAIPAK
jgi:hypothetical protein